jgi:hypothetical protein
MQICHAARPQMQHHRSDRDPVEYPHYYITSAIAHVNNPASKITLTSTIGFSGSMFVYERLVAVTAQLGLCLTSKYRCVTGRRMR